MSIEYLVSSIEYVKAHSPRLSSYTLYPIPYTRYHQTKSSGFSLVEVLVAAAVLIISVTGTLSLIARNVTSAAEAKDRVTAFYLAQEALEYVRGVRDNNAITNQNWLNGLDDCFSSNKCTVDVNELPEIVGDEWVSPGDQVEICSGSCSPLYLDSNGIYNQQERGEQTKFTREMAIEIIRAGEEVRVNATVKWMSGIERSFTISGNLFNWR